MKKKLQFSISDPDTRILASLAQGLQGDYINPETDPWTGSPFAWIRTRPSRQRGKIGEQLLAGWCATHDLNVSRSPDSEADRIVENHRVEIKFSTVWANGSYLFQQIRNQNYDLLICLGISPFMAHAWILSKKEVTKKILGHSEYSQHRGRQGSDTYWLRVSPDEGHVVFSPQSGKLSAVYKKLAELRK